MGWSWDYLACSFGQPWCENAQFFFDGLLGVTDGVGRIGRISWPALIGLALTWGCIYWIIKKGVLRVGKVVMLTVPLPAILLVLILTIPLISPGLNSWLGCTPSAPVMLSLPPSLCSTPACMIPTASKLS